MSNLFGGWRLGGDKVGRVFLAWELVIGCCGICSREGVCLGDDWCQGL